MNFDKCPEGMPYGQWLREKNIGMKVMEHSIHTDSGLPQSYLNHAKTPEEFERNLTRQGKKIDPEDM